MALTLCDEGPVKKPKLTIEPFTWSELWRLYDHQGQRGSFREWLRLKELRRVQRPDQKAFREAVKALAKRVPTNWKYEEELRKEDMITHTNR